MGDIWIKVKTNFWTSPEVSEIGIEASVLFLMANAWCEEHLTDGHVPQRIVKVLTKNGQIFVKESTRNPQRLVKKLTKIGWFIQVENGYQIANWEKWHKTKAQINHEKELTLERKRRQRAKRDVTEMSRRDKEACHGDVTASDNRYQITDITKESKEKTKTGSEIPTSVEVELALKKQVQKKRSRISESWTPKESSLAWLKSRQDLSSVRADPETEKFKNYHTAKGSLMLDWDAAWRNWMIRAKDFAPAKSQNQKSNSKPSSEEIIRRASEAVFGNEDPGESRGKIIDIREAF